MDTGKNKVQKICDLIKKETIEPAQEEGQRIIDEANERARKIIEDAKEEAKRIHKQTAKNIENEKNVFQASLNLACKQTVASLKYEIEEKLFNPALAQIITKEVKKPELLAKIIKGIISAIEKEGLDVKLTAFVPSDVKPQDVNTLLGNEILNRLKEGSVTLGDFAGGIKIKIEEKHLILDISDEALKDLLAAYVREDFRDLIFQV